METEEKRKKWSAQDRHSSRTLNRGKTNTENPTLAGAAAMMDGWAFEKGREREKINCRIEKYKLTKIYEMPTIYWQGSGKEETSRMLYSEKGFAASITNNIERYLKEESRHGQYLRDARLRNVCKEINKKSGDKTVFVVMEEEGETEEKEFIQGECWKKTEAGQQDEIIIFKTTDGKWPDGKENTEAEKIILSAIKLETEVAYNITRLAKCFCYETTEGEPVYKLEAEGRLSYGGLRTKESVQGRDVQRQAQKLRNGIKLIKKERHDESVRHVLDALLLGESNDEHYFMLWYLRLWQALKDFGKEYCVKRGIDLKEERKTVLYELLDEHRNDIAHWATEKVDYELLKEIQKMGIRIVKNSLQEVMDGKDRDCP